MFRPSKRWSDCQLALSPFVRWTRRARKNKCHAASATNNAQPRSKTRRKNRLQGLDSPYPFDPS